VIVTVARDDQRDQITQLLAQAAPVSEPDGPTQTVAATTDDRVDAVAVLDGRSRLATLADRDAEALATLLADLVARDVREARLWDHPASEAHHRALVAAGFGFVAESVVVRRTLVSPPAPTHRWTHVPERDLGVDAFCSLVARALEGTQSRYLAPGDPIETLGRDVPPSFRSRWWTAASVDGPTSGLVLPRPVGEGVAMSFIGLVPEARGRKLSSDLLADALTRLAAAGARWYVDETDVRDLAAQRMLAAVGCRKIGKRRRYRR